MFYCISFLSFFAKYITIYGFVGKKIRHIFLWHDFIEKIIFPNFMVAKLLIYDFLRHQIVLKNGEQKCMYQKLD